MENSDSTLSYYHGVAAIAYIWHDYDFYQNAVENI